MPTATACRATTCAPSSISAASPTAMPTTTPRTPQARFVANAFVALGHYYLEGIPNTDGEGRSRRARATCSPMRRPISAIPTRSTISRGSMLDGKGVAQRCQAGGALAAARRQQGPVQAQALLGRMLFQRRARCRASARSGLMWLTLARDGAGRQSDLDRRAARDGVQAGERRRARAWR